jgi:hypothetical protein
MPSRAPPGRRPGPRSDRPAPSRRGSAAPCPALPPRDRPRATRLRDRVLACPSGQLRATGRPAGLRGRRGLACPSGQLRATGRPAGLRGRRGLACPSGQLRATGRPAGLRRGSRPGRDDQRRGGRTRGGPRTCPSGQLRGRAGGARRAREIRARRSRAWSSGQLHARRTRACPMGPIHESAGCGRGRGRHAGRSGRRRGSPCRRREVGRCARCCAGSSEPVPRDPGARRGLVCDSDAIRTRSWVCGSTWARGLSRIQPADASAGGAWSAASS